MHRPHSKKHSPLWLKLILLVLLILAIALVDSRFRLVTDSFTLEDPDLPAAFDGFRIVQLSDLHEQEFGENNARLVAAVAKERPDLIALTGDFIDTTDGIAGTLALAEQLTAIAPVYFVSGNHDWASGGMQTLRTLLEDAGVTVLDNDWTLLERDGAAIALCGMEDPNGYADSDEPDEVVRKMRADFGDRYALVLAHRNYWPDAYPALDVNLILCGHGHGGVIRLPVVGGLLGSNGTLLPPYSAGVYESGPYQMLVSRGLGDTAAIPRLFNNPQVVSITLRAA